MIFDEEHAPPHTTEESCETLSAITSGEVDAVVVTGPHGPQVFRLEGPDQPFRTFVEGIQEGALALTAEGSILYANVHFARLTATPVGDLLGTPLSRFVPAGYHSTLARLVREGVEATVRGECRLESNGGSIPVQLTLSPLVGAARPSCCVVVFDLREREAAEEATAARIAAEEATRAKDQFLAVLSHELRSPLNTILGWAQILASDTSLGETTRRAVQAIERNARAQAAVVSDLLDVSRMIAGKLSLEMAHVDLGTLADAWLAAAKPAFEEHGVTLRRTIEQGANVYGDAARLQQIFTNLLNNALKFTEPGGAIDVRVFRNAGSVVLEVADTGAGMTPDLITSAFEPFHQAKTAQRPGGGLGLGLAIARQLTETHGGTLVAASPGLGKGSTFTVRLPLTPESTATSAAAFTPERELAGLAALVVEDDRDNLELIAFILRSAGCEVTAAMSAKEALARIDERSYGLLISDIGLPDQDGYALMREIRARGHDSEHLPAIALTGYAGAHDEMLVKAAGFQRHLVKPMEAGGLLRCAAELRRR